MINNKYMKHKYKWFDNEKELDDFVKWAIMSESTKYYVEEQYHDFGTWLWFLDDIVGICFMIEEVIKFKINKECEFLIFSDDKKTKLYINNADMRINHYDSKTCFEFIVETFKTIWYDINKNNFSKHMSKRKDYVKKYIVYNHFELLKSSLKKMEDWLNSYYLNLN